MPRRTPDFDRRELMLAGGGALAASAAPARAAGLASPIVELRQYTLHGGRRDELIALFDREFVESQEAVGARVIGQFRDLDDPDRFVWLRGFPDMEARRRALEAFYGGPVWQTHRNAANATMLDSDNVLLLKPAAQGGGFALGPRQAHRPGAIVTASIHYLPEGLLADFSAFFAERMRPRLEAEGARVLASFVTKTSANTFPRLPVRTADRVFVWFARFDGADAEAGFRTLEARASGWRDAAPAQLLPAFARKPERLRLSPTARSALA
jgi:NIPSNAP